MEQCSLEYCFFNYEGKARVYGYSFALKHSRSCWFCLELMKGFPSADKPLKCGQARPCHEETRGEKV